MCFIPLLLQVSQSVSLRVYSPQQTHQHTKLITKFRCMGCYLWISQSITWWRNNLQVHHCHHKSHPLSYNDIYNSVHANKFCTKRCYVSVCSDQDVNLRRCRPVLFDLVCRERNFGKISSACGQREIKYTEWRMNYYTYKYTRMYNFTCVFFYTPCAINIYWK